MHSKNNKKLLIINECDSKYLCITSCLFLIPFIGYYQYDINVINALIYMSLITFIASISYWYYPINGIRRYLDFSISNICCLSYILAALFIINCVYTKFFIFCILFTFTFFYYKSTSLYYLHNSIWVYYHMIFHLLVTLGKCVILYNINYYS